MEDLAIGEGAQEQEPSVPAEEPLGNIVQQALFGLACVVVIATVGSWVYLRSPALLSFGPVAGIAAALAVGRRNAAAFAAGLGAIIGFAIVIGPAPSVRTDPTILSQLGFAAAAAAAVAYGVSWLLEDHAHMRSILIAASVALVVLGMWSAVMSAAAIPAEDGSTFTGMLSDPPVIEKLTPDEGLYLIYVDRLRSGQSYYPMVGSVLQEANRKRIGQVDLGTALSFRLPTLYVALSKLPTQGVFLIIASLVAGTLAVLSAFALARRLAPPSIALVSAAAVAAYFGTVSMHANLLDTESWAGALVLLALALVVHAATAPRSRAAMWGAALATLAAASVRELAAPVLLLGLGATLVSSDLRRRKLWLPWLLAIAATAGIYYAHWSAATAIIRTLPKQNLPFVSWLDPTGAGLLAAMQRLGVLLELALPVTAVLAVAAMAGAFVASRSWAVRLAVFGTVAGGCAALLVVHPLGIVQNGGRVPSYWADLLYGPLLAAAPLFLTLLPGSAPQTAVPAEAEAAEAA